jgi:hypothetical protein
MTTRDSPTKARQLIDGASFGPEALESPRRGFDLDQRTLVTLTRRFLH